MQTPPVTANQTDLTLIRSVEPRFRSAYCLGMFLGLETATAWRDADAIVARLRELAASVRAVLDSKGTDHV